MIPTVAPALKPAMNEWKRTEGTSAFIAELAKHQFVIFDHLLKVASDSSDPDVRGAVAVYMQLSVTIASLKKMESEDGPDGTER